MEPDALRSLARPLRRALFDHVVNLRELRVADVLIALSFDEGLASAYVAEQRDLCVVTALSEGDVSEALAWMKARGMVRHHVEESRWEFLPDPCDWRTPVPAAAEPVRCRHRGAAAGTRAWATWGRLVRDARTGPRAPWLGAELDPLADPYGDARAEVSREQAFSALPSTPPARPEPVTDRLPVPAPARGLSRPPSSDRAVPPSSVSSSSSAPPAGVVPSVPPSSSPVEIRAIYSPRQAVNKPDPVPASLSDSLSESCRKSLGLSESLSVRARVSCAPASDASDVPDEETSSPSDGSGWTRGGEPDGEQLTRRLAEACGAESWAQWRGWWTPKLATAAGREATAEVLGELKWRRELAAVGRGKPVRNAGAWLGIEVRKRLATAPTAPRPITTGGRER